MMDELMESYMVIMAERDAAIRERNMALVEKKKMLTDREKAMLQRDAAICERNSVMIERDKVISQLKYKSCLRNVNNIPYGQQHHMNLLLDLAEAAYNPREVPFSDTFQNSTVDSATPKSKKVKRTKQTRSVLSKKAPKLSKNIKRGPKGLNKQAKSTAKIIWKNEQEDSGGRFEWNEDSGLQLVTFDLTKLVVPICSCTGKLQPCYKWGSGGWQSACCTTTISMFPLPHKENKPNARIGGRKMSGGVYTKLLHRLLQEGHDPSCPVDLKEHWARHGTNRYITIK